MQPTHEECGNGFSTADAEYPRIHLEHGSLAVSYRNWQERLVSLEFHDVAAFSWDDGEVALEDAPRDDQSYLVQNSQWLLRHRASGSLDSSREYKHFKLCFNAVGVLQVLATEVVVKAEPGVGADSR